MDYLHVELDRHDILLAEGLPAESYLDTGTRADFAGGSAALTLHPTFAAMAHEMACRRFVVAGPEVEAAGRGWPARAEAMERRSNGRRGVALRRAEARQ